MTNLCNALDLAPAPVRFAAYFRSTPDASRTDVYDQKLYAEAAALYRELEALTLTSKVLEGVDR